MKRQETYLGLVKQVKGSSIIVELSEELPSANPIIHGKIHRLGQIGSFIRIPLGTLNLYGIVSMVGSSAIRNAEFIEDVSPSMRWIQVQLLGESYQRQKFQRGLSNYPTIDDEVHVITEVDLKLLYDLEAKSHVSLGRLSASDSLPAYVDIQKLVTRHSAIVGSTGSGKSNTVAAILKSLSSDNFPNARVIVIDPHGEYAAALEGKARVFSIGSARNRLVVPYWALSMDELLWFLVDRRSANDTIYDMNIQAKIYEYKDNNCKDLFSGKIDPTRVTIDSPIPFSIKKLWYHFDRLERVTYKEIQRENEALIEEGNAEKMISASFKPVGMGNSAPFKPQPPPNMQSYVNKLYAKIMDKKYDFLLNVGKYNGKEKDIDDLLKSWLSHDKPITVLDLGGIPSEIIDLIVGVLSRIIYESHFWGRHLDNFGRNRPVLLVYEEAHSYLPRSSGSIKVAGYALRSVRRILKEGRKYGLGALLVSQRPSELDDTILSQCGTFISLRLSNIEDQARIKSTVPDTIVSLMDLLPSLRTGEAIVAGEAVGIPSRVRIPLIEPRPDSDDPDVTKAWKKTFAMEPELASVVKAWREQNPIKKTERRIIDGKDASQFK